MSDASTGEAAPHRVALNGRGNSVLFLSDYSEQLAAKKRIIGDCQHLDQAVYSCHRGLDRARREVQMGDVYSKIAGSWVRILGPGAVRRLTMAALLVTGSPPVLAQENRGTEKQRVACTPDVLRLCSWEIPNVDRIVACLRREKSQLSVGCRQVLKIEATASRAALNNGAEPRHAPRHHVARHRSPGDYERSDMH